MDSIKATIQGDDMDSSVEFSVEEVIAHQRGKRWGDMSDEEQEAAMKEYALLLVSRQGGGNMAGNPRVSLQEGTFSKERGRGV
jgi:hypothetical protein